MEQNIGAFLVPNDNLLHKFHGYTESVYNKYFWLVFDSSS